MRVLPRELDSWEALPENGNAIFVSNNNENNCHKFNNKYLHKLYIQLISGFHRAFLKSMAFIGRLMHSIV